MSKIFVWKGGKPVLTEARPLDTTLDVTLEEAKRMIYNLANQVGQLQKEISALKDERAKNLTR